MTKNLDHDKFFKTALGKPERAAQLLRLAAKHNEGLQDFLAAVNLDTLQPMPGEATREGLSGASDLTFRVNLRGSEQMANLHVGVLLEHKSYEDHDVLQQLMKYYFEVILQKAGNIPTVAIIVYNGSDDWNPITDPSYATPYPEYPAYFNKVGYPFICEFIDVGDEIDTVDFANADPQLALALVAMRYAFEPSERERFLAALKAFKALGREGALDFLKEVYVYLRKVIPVKDKELFMDTEEVLRNKGYKSISDADIELGEQRGIEKTKLEDAEAFLRDGDPVDRVARVLKLPLETVQAIADRIAKPA
ncbi:MAG: Rpn family recombination-promoting nuclease/putative transposase [Fibrobacter sp.]|nr:Rpn family recombination-promoting nuclease/putative transposase [Fibrobacter sp.]